MKRLLACLLLAAALVTNACALEVPTDTTIQNLNGSQQLIKTYTLPPGTDPQLHCQRYRPQHDADRERGPSQGRLHPG